MLARVPYAHSSLERNNEIHLGNKARRMTVNRLSDPGFDGEIRADRVKSTKTGCPVLPVVRFKGVGVQDKFTMENTERFVQAQYGGIVVPGLKSIATMQPEDLQILRKNYEREWRSRTNTFLARRAHVRHSDAYCGPFWTGLRCPFSLNYTRASVAGSYATIEPPLEPVAPFSRFPWIESEFKGGEVIRQALIAEQRVALEHERKVRRGIGSRNVV